MKKEIVQEVNKYLANTGVLYIKWHNLHWNVVGRQFKSIHEYLETLYDALADILDDTAELLIINGEKPLGSMKEFLAVTSIEELDSVDVTVESVLSTLTKDMLQMKKSAEELRALADKDDIFDIVGMLEDHLTSYNKNIWFLKAMGK